MLKKLNENKQPSVTICVIRSLNNSVNLHTYNQIGNILFKDGYAYSYNSGKPHAVANDGRFSYTYDANGNLTGRSDGRTLVWDYEDRIKTITESGKTHEFTYDAGGQRIKKKVTEAGVEKTVYYFFNTYEEEYTDGVLANSIKYYFANGERVAERSTLNGLRYFHKDHLGSSVVVTKPDQSVYLFTQYDPYGAPAYTGGDKNLGARV